MRATSSVFVIMPPLPAERVEAVGLDPLGELRAAGRDDAPVEQHVHDVGGEVVEDALVVRDQQDAELGRGARTSAMPWATVRSASMSRPLSVSSSTARSGSIIAICRISLRFFSPPEKPSLR